MTRFFALIVGVVVAFGALWLVLREYSKTKIRPSREHAFSQGPRPQVIAHRGGAAEAPENTIVAFSQALALDPEVAFEFDVRLTKDNKLVVFHDEHVERTTNGSGTIRSKTFDEIRQLDAGYHFTQDGSSFPYRAKGVQVPSLEEVLQALSGRRVIVEIKDEIPGISDLVLKAIKSAGAEKTAMVASEHGRMTTEARRLSPEIAVGASRDEILRSVILLEIQLSGFDPLKPDAYCIPEKHGRTTVLTEGMIRLLKENKRPLFVWTVNNPEDMKRLVALGVDGLITDRPSEMLRLKKSGLLAHQ